MGLELGHLQEPKPGVLSAEDGPHPWVVGVGVGWETPAVLLSALTLLRLPPGGGSEMVFIIVNYT